MNNNNILVERELTKNYNDIGSVIPLAIIQIISQYLNTILYLNRIQNKLIWNPNSINQYKCENNKQSTTINGQIFEYIFVIETVQLHRQRYIKIYIQFNSSLWYYFAKYNVIKFYGKIDLIIDGQQNISNSKRTKFNDNELTNGNNVLSISAKIPANALTQIVIKYEIFSCTAFAGIFCKRLSRKKKRKI